MKKPLGFRIKKYRILIPFVIIGMVYYFIFNYIPIIWGFLISLKTSRWAAPFPALPGWA